MLVMASGFRVSGSPSAFLHVSGSLETFDLEIFGDWRHTSYHDLTALIEQQED